MGEKGNCIELVRWLTPEYQMPFDYSKATLGTRLRYLRRRAGITITQLATQSGISHNSISRLERASSFKVNPTILEKLMQVLGVKLQEISPETDGDCYDLLIPPKTLGSWIKNARMKKGLQQKKLARLLGVNRETVRRWERDIVHPNSGLKPQLVQILGPMSQH
ncbi:MAG: transcriptional regulator [Elusimicrobia bacterium]|nr:transcriptional regulator [Candidatus Obscuribacterium magneticum]